MRKDAKIFVAGHKGLVGSAICRHLQNQGFSHVITRDRSEVDLSNAMQVEQFFQTVQPEYVFLAAAKVGGIHANNTYPAEFILTNLKIQNNTIENAHRFGVKKLLFLGSSCIYPKMAPQPIREDSFLAGTLEPTNEAYAVAKIAGIMTCKSFNRQFNTDYISCMPTNLYGENDNYHPENSHVLPALIRRFHEAKVAGASEVLVWGSGKPRREFLFSDDLAEACVFLMDNYSSNEIINVGCGEDIEIGELAREIAAVVGFTGSISFDTSKPDGTPRKLMDVSKINALGWSAKTPLSEGLKIAYKDFLKKEGGNNV